MESSEKEKQGSQSLCIIYPDLNDVFWQGDVVEGQHWESPAHSQGQRGFDWQNERDVVVSCTPKYTTLLPHQVRCIPFLFPFWNRKVQSIFLVTQVQWALGLSWHRSTRGTSDFRWSQTAFSYHFKVAHDYFRSEIGLDTLHHHSKIPDAAGWHGVNAASIWLLRWRLEEKLHGLSLKALGFLSHPGQWLASPGRRSTLNVIFRITELICFSQDEQRSPSDPGDGPSRVRL